jgi:hypothetical protein
MARQKDNGEIKKSHNYNTWIHQQVLELLEYLHPRLKDFVIYNFVAKWQDKVPQNRSHDVYFQVTWL